VSGVGTRTTLTADAPDTLIRMPPTVEDAPLSAADQTRRLRNGVISLAVLVALVTALLLAVPGLHGVAEKVSHIGLGWIVLALVLEILSCFGYVLTFMLVFDRAPLVFAARLAWTEMAFGAAVSLGGAGSLAIGAWVLKDRGAPMARVAERSAVLFLLTSAVNVITLTVFGLGLGLGIFDGPSNPLLSYLPGGVGVATLVFFLALPAAMERRTRSREPGRMTTILHGIATSIWSTARALLTPDWRLLGAVGYLLFDIGVLWVCLRATGHAPPFAAVVLAYQIAYLTNIIPIPGSLGVLDGSLIGMLTLYGTSATSAAAATVVYHGIALWIPSLIGTIAFIRLRRSASEPLTLRPPKAQRRQARTERRRERKRRP
jgi:uncharacterized membrane protein YbhN (UPF0104 family)